MRSWMRCIQGINGKHRMQWYSFPSHGRQLESRDTHSLKGRISRLDAMTTRRNVLIALGASALAAPISWPARAQTHAWRIGFLWLNEQSFYLQRFEAFRTVLQSVWNLRDDRQIDFTTDVCSVRRVRMAHHLLSAACAVRTLRIASHHALSKQFGKKAYKVHRLRSTMVALKVDLIVPQGTPGAVAARNATREIPILITNPTAPNFNSNPYAPPCAKPKKSPPRSTHCSAAKRKG